MQPLHLIFHMNHETHSPPVPDIILYFLMWHCSSTPNNLSCSRTLIYRRSFECSVLLPSESLRSWGLDFHLDRVSKFWMFFLILSIKAWYGGKRKAFYWFPCQHIIINQRKSPPKHHLYHWKFKETQRHFLNKNTKLNSIKKYEQLRLKSYRESQMLRYLRWMIIYILLFKHISLKVKRRKTKSL